MGKRTCWVLLIWSLKLFYFFMPLDHKIIFIIITSKNKEEKIWVGIESEKITKKLKCKLGIISLYAIVGVYSLRKSRNLFAEWKVKFFVSSMHTHKDKHQRKDSIPQENFSFYSHSSFSREKVNWNHFFYHSKRIW